MSMTVYECPMGHVRSILPEHPSMLPLHCIECEGELIPVEYTPVKKEFELAAEDRMQVDDDGFIFWLDRYFDGKKKEPGIMWKLIPSGWIAHVFDEKAQLLWRTKSHKFPHPADIISARENYYNFVA